MKKLAIALLFCCASAFAVDITYSTSAVLAGTDALGGALKNGTAMITYTPQAPITVSAPTGINIGYLTVSGGSGTFTGDSIALTITQTSPTGGSGMTSSTIAGSISGTSNSIQLTFAPTTFTIGGVVYNLQSNYFLVAPNTNNGVTTLQANVAAPEPASLGLLGASLLGIGLAYRRKTQS